MADLADTLRFTSDLSDGSGTLVNAASVVLTITLPDGTTATPTITNPPAVTGQYFCDYAATVQGRYVATWVFTLAGGATASYVDVKDARVSLVTVGEALGHLRAAGVIRSEPDLELLQQLTFYATDAVERDLGRVIVKRTVSETYDGGRPAIALLSTPVISITSVVEAGVTRSAGDYILRRTGWLLQRGTTTAAFPWAYGWENIAVTYIAGYNDPPPVTRKVALNAVQGMWRESQQAPMPSLQRLADEAVGESVASLHPVERSAYDSLRAAGIA